MKLIITTKEFIEINKMNTFINSVEIFFITDVLLYSSKNTGNLAVGKSECSCNE